MLDWKYWKERAWSYLLRHADQARRLETGVYCYYIFTLVLLKCLKFCWLFYVKCCILAWRVWC